MSKLKQLKDKKNMLLNDLEEMVTALENEGEVRSLNDEEVKAFDEKKDEIRRIDETIARIEEQRAKEISPAAVKGLHEERNKEEEEVRALENFFRGQDLALEERKMLASTASNQALLPLSISKTIMQKLEELCPVMEFARRFNSKGTLRLIKENAYGNAAMTPEDQKFHDTDVEFTSIELKVYKVSAMVQATFEMLANSEIELSNYLLDVIVRRLARELNKFFLVGTGVNQPQGLINGELVEPIAAELDIKQFIAMQTAMNPSYLDKACWIVNRKTFQEMAKLLDGSGRPYLSNNVIGEKIQYTLLGIRVIVDSNMDNYEEGKKPVILANIGEAYAINVLTDITVKHLTEIGFTQG